MNRKERRAKGKNYVTSKEPVYQMRQSDIDKIKNDARKTAADDAMVLLLALPIKVLHDSYGWGTVKRLPEFAEKLTDEYQAFADGEISLKEYADLVFQYTGLKFERG